MNEERIQLLCDLLLVRKFQCALERDPVRCEHHWPLKTGSLQYVPHALEVHGADLNDVPRLFALQDTVSASTRHTSHIKELCAIDHVIIYRDESATN